MNQLFNPQESRRPKGIPARPVGGNPPGGPGVLMSMPIPGVDYPITTAEPQYEDLAYATISPAQKLDLYLPTGSGPFPVVLLVHGGGFAMGDKSHDMSKPGTDQLLSHGYAVANVNYRLSSEAKAPAQIRDIKTAVRWLRGHAREYYLRQDRFGAWGASSGGNLVALLGTSCGVSALEGAEMGHTDQSSCIQAVVDWFGPIDFLQMDRQFSGMPDCQTHDSPESPESRLIGAPIQTRPDLVKIFNPITYISKDVAPFLIQHGTADTLVPWQQSQLLYDSLEPIVGADKVTLTLLKGVGHGGGPQFWSNDNVALIIGFLDKYLCPR